MRLVLVLSCAVVISSIMLLHSWGAGDETYYIGQNKPVCVKDFLPLINKRIPEDTCRQVVREMTSIAQKNVRLVYCTSGTFAGQLWPYIYYNVVFLSKRIFVTTAHSFFVKDDRFGHELPRAEWQPLPDEYLKRCHLVASPNTVIDTRIQPMKGDGIRTTGDYAVAAVRGPLPDIEPLDIAGKFEIANSSSELWSFANYTHGDVRGCLAVTPCSRRELIFRRSGGKGAPALITDCPGIHGTSGSAVFLIRRDRAGQQCQSFALAALGHGTSMRASNGSPYFYTHDVNDPALMVTTVVGV
jgi:hypothetical protein